LVKVQSFFVPEPFRGIFVLSLQQQRNPTFSGINIIKCTVAREGESGKKVRVQSLQHTNTKIFSLQNFRDQTQRKIQKYQEHSCVLHNSKIFPESNTNQIITDSHHISKSLPIQAKQTRTGPVTTQIAQIRTSQASPRSETKKGKKNEGEPKIFRLEIIPSPI